MKKQILLLSVMTLLGITVLAQLPKAGKGPGGIGNDSGLYYQPQNIIWLRADKGLDVEYDGNGDPTSTVLTWFDQSGNAKDALSTYNGTKPAGYTETLPTAKPQVEYNKLNGKPWLRFGSSSANATLIIPDEAANPKQIDGCANMCIAMVFKRSVVPPPNTFERLIMKWDESGDHTPNRAFAIQFDGGTDYDKLNLNINGYTGTAPRFDQKSSFAFRDTNAMYIFLWNYRKNFGTAYNVYLYMNGALDAYSSYSTAVSNSNSPFVISSTAKLCIAEIIMYRNGLNSAQSIILQNALAAKYGLNLPTRYYNNYGTSTDVIGIGRGEEDAFFYHTASSGGNLILWGDSLTMGKREFIMAGHDTAQVITADGSGNWSRTWYFQVTGTITAKAYFDFRNTGFAIDTTEANAYNLYYSTDGLFYSIKDTNGTLVDSTVMYDISSAGTGYYKIGKLTSSTVADPVITPNGLPYTDTAAVNVTLSCATGGSSIYYTLDGSLPLPGKTGSVLYTGAITIPLGFTQLKAKAFINLGGGYFASGVVSSTYLLVPTGQVSAPEFSPLPGPYNNTQSVTITCATSGAAIYYSTDGSTPDSSSATSELYTGAISVAINKIIKAIAYQGTLTPSAVTIGNYVIGGVNNPKTENTTALNVYPNPASGQITIESTGFINGPVNIRVYSHTGALVHSVEAVVSGSLEETIDVSTLTPGIYLIEVAGKSARKVERFIKQ